MSNQTLDPKDSWEHFLNPDRLKNNLMCSSIYLTAYEILQQSLMDRLNWFFSEEFSSGEAVPGEKYQREVLTLDKMPFFASANWFKSSGAISKEDIAMLHEI